MAVGRIRCPRPSAFNHPLLLPLPREVNQALHPILTRVGHLAESEHSILISPSVGARLLTRLGTRPGPLHVTQFDLTCLDCVSAGNFERSSLLHVKLSVAIEVHGKWDVL